LDPTIDNRAKRAGKPSVHALIVGVSDYGPYLPSSSDQAPSAGPPTFGMRSLTAPAASAAAVFEWLVCNQSYLPYPLGTCRLLLAPSAAERARLKLAPEHKWSTANKDSFVEAVCDWRDDASQRPGHITLFYFSGHGVQLQYDKQVLLFPGFGRPGDRTPALWEGVLLDQILSGMAPSSARENVANTQLYFIDACRNPIDYFKIHQEYSNVPDLWQSSKIDHDNRYSSVFHATEYGSEAYAIPNDVTVFAQALIDCLSGLAGVEDDYDPATDKSIWWVTANSLNQAIHYSIQRVSEAHKLPPQQVNATGKLANVRIVRLPDAPLFPVCLRAVPSGADKLANMEVCDEYGNPLPNQKYAQPLQKHPIWTELPGGTYKVREFGDSPPLGSNAKRTRSSKIPPNEWNVQFKLQ
jgi:hypothetical protein